MRSDLVLVLFGMPALMLGYSWFVYWMNKAPSEARSAAARPSRRAR